MLELYHSINSVCAQKIRIALAEKGLAAKEHLMTLRGDQFDPAYMKLNPNAVVPTLIHDGNVIVESSVILYYLDEAFPPKPLMPQAPTARAKVRLFNKLVDEYVHNACIILTFGTAFRPALLRLSPEEREAHFSKSPIKRRAEIKRDVVAHGLDSEFMRESLETHEKLLHWIDDAMKRGAYLAGETFSLADIGVIPYVLRLELVGLAPLWDRYPAVGAWWQRVRSRPSVEQQTLERMTESDWAPFRSIQADPWPKLRDMLAA
ncbi:MAG TPA: glutathione S-transferase family protein [Xanthobacteraceae bacterium]|jgi:glutathione S-transferase